MARNALRPTKSKVFHVVRADRYACGAKIDAGSVAERRDAHKVNPFDRCMRIGCSNDYAKADREARES